MARFRSFVVVGLLVAFCWASSALSNAQSSASPTNQVVAQAPKPTPQSATVYITKTGEKYHLGSCRSLRKSRIETTVAEAKRRGFTACKICKPPS